MLFVLLFVFYAGRHLNRCYGWVAVISFLFLISFPMYILHAIFIFWPPSNTMHYSQMQSDHVLFRKDNWISTNCVIIVKLYRFFPYFAPNDRLPPYIIDVRKLLVWNTYRYSVNFVLHEYWPMHGNFPPHLCPLHTSNANRLSYLTK